jgi:NAD-dependent DNA ligase
MGSMNKTKSLKDLSKWILKQRNNNKVESFVITPKIDGTSALIIFELNSLKNLDIKIYTRGDGDVGKRIDFLAEYLIPETLRSQIIEEMNNLKLFKLVLRGEMIFSKKNFAAFSEKFKCPRSMVNGITNKKENIDCKALSNLDYALFEIIEPKLVANEQFKLAKKIGMNFVEWQDVNFNDLNANLLLKNDTQILESLPGKILTNYRDNYKYDIDGIIITSNIEYEIPKSGNPEYSIAFKINQRGEVTTVRKVEWNVSKHGVLKPKLVFDKIRLGSSDVERSTGFNGSYIFNNSLGPGAIIRVVLSGEIIPYVTDIVEQSPMPSMPDCGYKWNDTKIDCVILEDNDCLRKKKILTFIKTIQIDYLAEGLISHLFENGFTSLKSILKITKEELLKLDRIEEKMATKLIKSINDKVFNPLKIEYVMDGSLCFGNGFGLKRCSQIVSKFPNFLDSEPEVEDLFAIPGWSEKSINKFKEGLSKFRIFLKENDYLHFETKSTDEKPINKSKCLVKKICITGKRDKDILSFLKNNGIEIVNSVTRDVQLLICDDVNSNSSKIITAKKRGIEILDLDTFKTSYVFE